MLMNSPSSLDLKKDFEQQEFLRSPQIIYDINSYEQIPLNWSIKPSNLNFPGQQSLILRSGRSYCYNYFKQDLTQIQNENNQGLEQQVDLECLMQKSDQLDAVNITSKKISTKSQAFKIQKKTKILNITSLKCQQPCNCKSSGCIKRYCRCFHSGKTCLPECQCQDGCLNKEHNNCERSEAIKHVNEKCYRNRKIPKEALFKLDVIYGCSCTKSKCRKRYCECFLRNQNCTEKCKCFDCCNRQIITE
ncbi:unnamed protein product (macronuclear) [Paramecium tetraurelia]|uniref:CRC domain-containing protein n=1 Tax=Paramecium tetraurelia TaxID=5888 RepID=A0C016_PARTE|nr:uncharacterized protein GSPATT00005986001 [Paramecium tetraurelia]CAK64133.1 unnamed protein product [Paramecium tetraurelia]|eukprot:XP_001431531.1 hypothetical protein (macronuclear) [Paramecium tetraurelia strain d4-2]